MAKALNSNFNIWFLAQSIAKERLETQGNCRRLKIIFIFECEADLWFRFEINQPNQP